VQQEVGFVLYRAQIGQYHHNIKPLKGFSGVMEIVSSHDKDAYRTVYAIKLGKKIYVLHAFKKKSKTGIKTPKKEIDIIRQRLQWAKQLAKEDK
jgi:phage-related protein